MDFSGLMQHAVSDGRHQNSIGFAENMNEFERSGYSFGMIFWTALFLTFSYCVSGVTSSGGTAMVTCMISKG